VIITAKNPARKLLPGMTAIVEIVTGKSEGVLRVPNDAVRFKPAAGSELAKRTVEARNGNGGSGHGGPRRGPDIDQLKASLDLDDPQVTAIKTELQEVFSTMRSQFQAMAEGGDRSAVREQMNQRMTAVFKKNLTPEQFKQYQQIRRQASESRNGQIWIQSKDGEIQPVAVKFGISDDNYTQILGKNVKQGDVVITRIRNVRK